jgi:hypothetical protein
MAGERLWTGRATDVGGRRADDRGELVESGYGDDDCPRAQPAYEGAEHRGGGGQRGSGETRERVARFGVTEESQGDVPVRRRYPTQAWLVEPRQCSQLLDGLRWKPHGEEESSHPPSVAPSRRIPREQFAPTSGSTMST